MLERGTAVRSSAGRDKGKLLAIVQAEKDRVLVCDGKERPIDRPKSQNIRHIVSVGAAVTEAELASNRALRKALRRLNAEINGNT